MAIAIMTIIVAVLKITINISIQLFSTVQWQENLVFSFQNKS